MGRDGFAETSVEDLAAAAGVTTGALYHHFPTKTLLFETVFEELHMELLVASGQAAVGVQDAIGRLAQGFEEFLDAVLDPVVQRIIIIDAPAVLGLAGFTELDEKYAFSAIVAALADAANEKALHVKDPETFARLLLGALTRGAMLIANSTEPTQTRNAVARTMREMLAGLAQAPS